MLRRLQRRTAKDGPVPVTAAVWDHGGYADTCFNFDAANELLHEGYVRLVRRT